MMMMLIVCLHLCMEISQANVKILSYVYVD